MAVRWLHHLGFKPVSYRKGVYIDGHEREDVVRHRSQYLDTMVTLRDSHQQPRVRNEGDDDKKQLVVIYQAR